MHIRTVYHSNTAWLSWWCSVDLHRFTEGFVLAEPPGERPLVDHPLRGQIQILWGRERNHSVTNHVPAVNEAYGTGEGQKGAGPWTALRRDWPVSREAWGRVCAGIGWAGVGAPFPWRPRSRPEESLDNTPELSEAAADQERTLHTHTHTLVQPES